MADQQAFLNVIQAEELVERLLQIRGTQFTPIENALCTEAADLIETLLSATADLTRQLAEVREALGEAREAIASLPSTDSHGSVTTCSTGGCR